jgi:hypothetical protein
MQCLLIELLEEKGVMEQTDFHSQWNSSWFSRMYQSTKIWTWNIYNDGIENQLSRTYEMFEKNQQIGSNQEKQSLLNVFK